MPALGEPESVVMFDTPCTSCGYSLRGLYTDSVCPECGVSIRASLERRRLGLAAPEYLGSLDLGSSAALLGLLLMVALGVVDGLEYTTLGGIRSGLPPVAWPLLDLGVSLPLAVGLWKLTRDDPGLPAHDQARGNARALRAAAVALPVVHGARFVIASAGSAMAPIAALVPMADVVAGVVGAMAVLGLWLVIATGLCNLLRWLAARLPDPRLYGRAKRAGRLLPVFLLPAAFGPVGLVPGALWLAVVVRAARERIARAGSA